MSTMIVDLLVLVDTANYTEKMLMKFAPQMASIAFKLKYICKESIKENAKVILTEAGRKILNEYYQSFIRNPS